VLATALSTCLIGLDAEIIRVEVEVVRNVPSFELVGLAEVAVRESRVRVKSALAQVGADLSECRVIVNLSPADLKKRGSGFDLAIAIATLAGLGRISQDSLEGVLFLGELSLSGALQGLRGVLPQLLSARARGVARAVVPLSNAEEAAEVSEMDTRVAGSIGEVLRAFRDGHTLARAARAAAVSPGDDLGVGDDMSEVLGQHGAKRALEIAASGGHNVLMVGPPGAGKTMLAKRVPSLLPPMQDRECVEVMALHSIAGLLLTATSQGASQSGSQNASRMDRKRPFRAPHHTLSEVALVGGGEPLRPGEVSLAHRGVLFLDELPEFRRPALEALREPLEDGVVTISRAAGKASFPARPLVVAAMNPCPCGHYGDPRRTCLCSEERRRRYAARVSGPLLDRLDVHIALPALELAHLRSGVPAERSAMIRERVARTIADLEGSSAIQVPHVAEAIGARTPITSANTRDAA
jgi:magnesium chelatase family protein